MKHDFCIVAHAVHCDSHFIFDTVKLLHQELVEMTLKEALNRMQEISDTILEYHKVSLKMKYSDDKKPRGFNNIRPIYKTN